VECGARQILAHGNCYDRRDLLEFGERLDLVLWETCHIYATCQAYRAEADFQHSPISKRTEYAGPNGPIGLIP